MADNSWSIRDVVIADLPVVRALLRETWHATYDRLYGADQVRQIIAILHSVEALTERCKQPRSQFILAETDDKIVACTFMHANDDDVGFLGMIYIHPSMQGRGLGQALLAALADLFPKVSVFRLEVDPQNETAVRFYKAQGFVTVGTVRDCAGIGYDIPADVMEMTRSS